MLDSLYRAIFISSYIHDHRGIQSTEQSQFSGPMMPLGLQPWQSSRDYLDGEGRRKSPFPSTVWRAIQQLTNIIAQTPRLQVVFALWLRGYQHALMQSVVVTKMSRPIPAVSGLKSIFDQQGYNGAKPKYRDKSTKRKGSGSLVRSRPLRVKVSKDFREDNHDRTLGMQRIVCQKE